jgi:imidazoleglycerol phosphate dehydratase HisB
MKSKRRVKADRPEDFATGVGRALRRAAKDARKIARMYGTPIYVLKHGKVVAEKP